MSAHVPSQDPNAEPPADAVKPRRSPMHFAGAGVAFSIALGIFFAKGTPPITVFYHVPIYLVVGYVLADFAGRRRDRSHGANLRWALLFAIGTTLSILRETHHLPISGHVLWSVLLWAYLITERPGNLLAQGVIALVFCQVAGMKIFTERHLDPPGLIFGLCAGAILASWPLMTITRKVVRSVVEAGSVTPAATDASQAVADCDSAGEGLIREES